MCVFPTPGTIAKWDVCPCAAHTTTISSTQGSCPPRIEASTNDPNFHLAACPGLTRCSPCMPRITIAAPLPDPPRCPETQPLARPRPEGPGYPGMPMDFKHARPRPLFKACQLETQAHSHAILLKRFCMNSTSVGNSTPVRITSRGQLVLDEGHNVTLGSCACSLDSRVSNKKRARNRETQRDSGGMIPVKRHKTDPGRTSRLIKADVVLNGEIT